MGAVSSSKQRALDALEGKCTDIPPALLFAWEFDYVGVPSGIEPWEIACGGPRWDEVYNRLAAMHGQDIVLFSHAAGAGVQGTELLDEDGERWRYRDRDTGIIYEMLKKSLSVVRTEKPKDCPEVPRPALDSIGDIEQYPVQGAWSEYYLQRYKETTKSFGDRALVVPYGCPSYISACYLLGFERAMSAMVEDKEFFHRLISHLDSGLQQMMRSWRSAGAEAVFIADSWASCDIISPELFREFALPAQRAICDAAHREGLKIILWNAGNILPILELEARAGFDAFGFEQSRKGYQITLPQVRKAFGNTCLLGNADPETLFIEGSAERVRQEAVDQVRQNGDAPFILCTGSPIPHNANPMLVDVFMKTRFEV